MSESTSSRGTIRLRPAAAADSRAIATFFCMAGGGLYEFLFDGLVPFLGAVDLLSIAIAGTSHPIAFRNCCVAVDSRDQVIGAANAFPADDLKNSDYGLIPSDRLDHVRKLLEHQDWGSMFLNALAVDEAYRGAGIGRQLIGYSEQRARSSGFDRLSLHVWADNAEAIAFYRSLGFVELGTAAVDPHPRLAHVGGSILMRRHLDAMRPPGR